MAFSRRNFLKISASSGLALASSQLPLARAGAPPEAPPEAVGILYDATLCIGCKSCMVNCKKYNAMPDGALYTDGTIPYENDGPNGIYDAPSDLSAKTLNIIKAYTSGTGETKDQPENGFSFIKQHCFHCIDPACASVCPVGALKKNSVTGAVTYDKGKCIGCRYCQVACPFSIPKIEWDITSPEIRKCQLCSHRMLEGGYAACCEFCPTGASLFGPVADLREEAKLRLSLTPGEYYDYPVHRIDGNDRVPKKVSTYYNHAYGLTEAGGTQYLLLAGVPFEHLGINPRITDQNYPSLTWSYIAKVPLLILALLAAGTALHLKTRDKDQT